ncbi:NYN domain-containing protein [Domibacillus mangrovi]|uniref:NYN domain-containing protein n=1 Tax=Domibacillus mangrovi TaxID=1714354 RepID=A0A1Q5P633_9BACI|nr:NYN domain-containing protein [Domibacillus mangrovi]OKL37611.1 NYN domain-containing protein [Domibacillus mangrovi]
MKRVAIIVDGQFLLHRIKDATGERRYPDPEKVYTYMNSLIEKNEEVYRIFFYQGEPSKQRTQKPFSKEWIEFKDSDTSTYNLNLFSTLSKQDLMAIRLGDTQFRGWKLKSDVQKRLMDDSFEEEFKDHHFTLDFQQKGVDIKIGLDVAWLASKKLVDRIIMVTGDADFVPAMKFARREGLQVVLQKIGPRNINDTLEIHSDYVRCHSNKQVNELIQEKAEDDCVQQE